MAIVVTDTETGDSFTVSESGGRPVTVSLSWTLNAGSTQQVAGWDALSDAFKFLEL